MLADQLDYVVGVDTHRDAHTIALIAALTGAVVLEIEVGADQRGYARALTLAFEHAAGSRLWAIEGSGSYGAGLARFLAEQGERVVEVERPQRTERTKGKSDRIDALRAARTALGQTKLALPRAGGARQALRALVTTRKGAVATRRAALNQLRALIVIAPESLRAELRQLTRAKLIARCARLRAERHACPELRGTTLALRACARRVQAATAEERELRREIVRLVNELAPQLLAEPGVGPISAAQLLVSWSHGGRFAGEAGFARHAGAAPIPASSGQVVRSLLDRGGDRQLNRALHTILVARHKRHAPTIAYIERRRSEGKSVREALRCLKRFLARHLFRVLEAGPLAT
ncbi:MAG TPA: IS110 family transposase [Gaiellaceae bacterium]